MKTKVRRKTLIEVASVWCCSVVGPESRATEVIWLWTLTAVWLVPHDSRASLTQTEAPIGTALWWVWSLSQYFQLWRPVPIAQIARQDWRRRKEPNVSSLCRGVFWKAQISDYEYNKSAIISVERDRKCRTHAKPPQMSWSPLAAWALSSGTFHTCRSHQIRSSFTPEVRPRSH